MTEREAFEYREARLRLYGRAGGRCEVCGAQLPETWEIAHRIPQEPRSRHGNLARYGKEIIHHPLNVVATCGPRCNSAVNIRNRPAEIDALVARIREAIKEEQKWQTI